MEPQHLAQVAKGLVGCAGLGKADLHAVQKALAATTVARGESIPLREVCCVVSGLGGSRYVDDRLMGEVASRVLDGKEEMNAIDVLCILHPLAA